MSEERVILHSDMNHCYAQIEEMKYPELRNYPMVVGGNEETRHGIILAKNDIAKKFNIKTGESLREATAKCPQLLIRSPDYEEYIYYTEKVKDVYRRYTDKVESFGLDEAWLDVSASIPLFGEGFEIAKEIQQKIWLEIGLSVSIGISYNKIFAKLGSDMKKKMGLVEISKENFKEKVWPLPVEDLLYVGSATKKKLAYYAITTIGELAQLRVHWMRNHFGKMGEIIWWFANGKDVSDVALSSFKASAKSVGNAITAPKDICTLDEAKLVYYVLVESVAARLREQGLCGNIICISLRSKDLTWFSRQQKIMQPTNIVNEIMVVVLALVKKHYDFHIPLRSIGVTLSGLEPDTHFVQMNLFICEEERRKQKKLEETMERVRKRFGFEKIKRCAMVLDTGLTDFNPKDDHIIHPVGYF